MVKYGSLDKVEAYLPPKEQFIHDDYLVSQYATRFSNRSGYMYDPTGRVRGTSYGVDKRIGRVADLGIIIDDLGVVVGKSCI
jgi:hypothetical protein